MEDKSNVAAAMNLCACEKDGGDESDFSRIWNLLLAITALSNLEKPERDLKAEKISYLSGKVDALEDLLYGRKREGEDGNH